MEQLEGQINILEQGFGRDKCIFNKDYPCNHYWGIRTMQECGDGYCDKKCCKSCNELCGYRCNSSSYLYKGE